MIFQVFKTENLKNEDIFKVYKNTMFKIDAPEKNIKDKIMIVRNRPNCKLKNTDKEVIDKDMFDDLVKSFPTYFSFWNESVKKLFLVCFKLLYFFIFNR